MKVSELTGAQLDYWVARAEGMPAENLQIRGIQRSTEAHCVRTVRTVMLGPDQSDARDVPVEALRYSTDWAQGGPLQQKHGLSVVRWSSYGTPEVWVAFANGDSHYIDTYQDDFLGEESATPLQAICRAVARAAFGDDVDEAPIRTA
ncbi:phage protein NinX family protein [[Empedobacter] haloabium]|uniref:Phage protein NinX family protein n=1 Tax=[Empedobacter] haloabium TaxID=592317 RepID=A0ABZ1USN8_9BURK